MTETIRINALYGGNIIPVEKIQEKIEGASEYVPFRIEHYSSEDLYGDDEFWKVTNQRNIQNPTKSFKCESLEDAEWLTSQLNRED